MVRPTVPSWRLSITAVVGAACGFGCLLAGFAGASLTGLPGVFDPSLEAAAVEGVREYLAQVRNGSLERLSRITVEPPALVSVRADTAVGPDMPFEEQSDPFSPTDMSGIGAVDHTMRGGMRQPSFRWGDPNLTVTGARPHHSSASTGQTPTRPGATATTTPWPGETYVSPFFTEQYDTRTTTSWPSGTSDSMFFTYQPHENGTGTTTAWPGETYV